MYDNSLLYSLILSVVSFVLLRVYTNVVKRKLNTRDIINISITLGVITLIILNNESILPHEISSEPFN